MPGQSVRLRGSTLKVWDAGALMAQRPLLVVHDGEGSGVQQVAWVGWVGWERLRAAVYRSTGSWRLGVWGCPPAAPAGSCGLEPVRPPSHLRVLSRRCCCRAPPRPTVLKHMQLEDGLLFMWRISNDATIITVRLQ